MPLARVGSSRLAEFPQVPALTELAPGFEPPPGWEGMFLPAATPAAIVRRLQSESARALNSPATKARFGELGFEVIANTPEEFAKLIQSQINLVSRIAKSANIKPIE